MKNQGRKIQNSRKKPGRAVKKPDLVNRSSYAGFQLFPDQRAYAIGFAPDLNLSKFLKTPIPPKTAGVFSLLLATCLAVFSGISTFDLFFRSHQLDQTALIQTSQTIKNSPIVAGGQPIKWVVLVDRNDLTDNQYLLKLPKNAKNIKITSLSPQQAEAVVAQAKVNQQTPLTTEERKQLAAASKPSDYFTAGLLSRFSRFFLGSAKNAIDQIVEAVVQEEVTVTDDAKLVDLSEQIVEPIIEAPSQPEEKEAEKEEKQQAKEEKKQDKEEPVVEETAPVETPAEEPAPEEIPVETPAEIITETEEQEPVIEEAPEPEPAPVETPAEVVQVEYETPAPTITEQETDTGKLVTVSSDAAEVNCESLKPANQVSVLSYIFNNNLTASLSSAVSNFFSVISKFLFADLEQAVSEAVEAILDQVIPPAEEAPAETPVAEEEPVVEEEPEPVEELVAEEVPAVEETPIVETPPVEEPLLAEIPSLTETASPSDQPVAEAPAEEGPVPAEAPEVSADDAAYQQCLAEQIPLTDVLAFTTIPEIYKVGQEDRIKIKWKNNNDQEMTFAAYDTDNNGKLDYVEWIVPHLSDQIFEIIFIIKAIRLDASQQPIEDIYDQVKTQDGTYASITDGQYVRATFGQVLDNTRDNTIYAEPTNPDQPAIIEVYPVYTDADGNQTQGPLIATFDTIDHEDTYKVLLTDLQTPTDVFDLKIIGNVDIDYIVDPAVTLYWVGSAGGSTTVAANWNSTEAACSGSGDAVAAPSASDTAIFTNTCDNSATVLGALSVTTLTFNTGYAGTVTASANISVSGNLSVSAGVLAMSTYTLAVTGNSTVTGGTVTIGAGATGWTTTNLTIGTGGTVTCSGNSKIGVSGNWDSSAGTFTASTSTVTFNGSSSQSINTAASFNNVTLNNNTFTLASNVTVGGNLVISEAKTPTITANTSQTFTVTGTTDGTNGGAVETLTVNTTGAVTFTGAVGTGDADMLTALTITNSAALLFSSTINITGALTQTNAATGTTTFTGAVNCAAATLKGVAYTVSSTFTATGAVAVTNSGIFTKGATGAITAPGGFSTSGAATLGNNITTTNTTLSIGGNLVLSEAATPTLAAGSGAITVVGTTDGTNGGAVETLTVNTTGAVTFTGAVGTGDADMLTALTITNSAALAFSAAVNITGAFTQTNAATGTTTFSSTLAAGSATFRGTTINLGGTTTISGNLNVAVGTLATAAGCTTVTVGAGITAAAGTTIDFATAGNPAVNITGDSNIDSTTLSMGSGIWTITNGTFDIKDVTTLNSNTSTVTVSGTSTLTGKSYLYNLNVPAGQTLNIATTTATFADAGTLTINGTVNIADGLYLKANNQPSMIVGATGIINGPGQIYFYIPYSGKGLTSFAVGGQINANVIFYSYLSGARLAAGTYAGNVSLRSYPDTGVIELDNGAYVFNGDLSIGPYDSTISLTLANNVNGPTSITVNGTFTARVDTPASLIINDSGQTVNWIFNGDVSIWGNPTMGTLTWTAGSGTITLGGGNAQNIRLSGASVPAIIVNKTAGTTATLSLSGGTTASLTITSGTLQLSTLNFAVTGATSISGTLNDNSATGTNTFTGAVTINAGGIWTTTNNPGFTFQGGLTNDSSAGFTSGTGAYTFDTNAQTISGSQAFTITNLTNNITSSTGLTFSGAQPTVTTLTQGTNAILTFSGAMPAITTLTATAAGNTVNYTSTTDAQALKATTYVNLGVNNAGRIASLAGTTTVGGNLAVSGGTLAIDTYDLSVTGSSTVTGATATIGISSNTGWTTTDMTIGAGGTVTCAGASKISVSGNWDSSNATSTFTISTSTVTFTAAAGDVTIATITGWTSKFNNLTINSGSNKVVWNTAVSAGYIAGVINITGELDINGASSPTILNTGNLTINANSTLGGTGTLGIVKGNGYANITNNGTISIANFQYLISGSATTAPVTATTYGGNLLINGANAASFTAVISSGTLNVTGTLKIDSNNGLYTATLSNSNNSTIVFGGLEVGASSSTAKYGIFIAANSSSGTPSVTVNGNVTIYASDASGINEIDAYGSLWSVTGNWANSDTFTARTSTVSFTKSSDTQTLTSNSQSFYNLTHSGAGTLQLADELTITGALNNSAGVLDTKSGSNYGITIAGNWTNSATFTANLGTVTFNGSSQTISGTNTFNNFTAITPDQVIIFPQASTTTISGTLKLEGSSGHNILLKSDEAGVDGSKANRARVDIAAVSDNHSNAYFQYVTPYDNNASNGAAQPISVQAQNCFDGGNNTGWGFDATAPVLATGVNPATLTYDNTATTVDIADVGTCTDATSGMHATQPYQVSYSDAGTSPDADCSNNVYTITTAWGTSHAANFTGTDGHYYCIKLECKDAASTPNSTAYYSANNIIYDISAPTTSDNFTNNNAWQNGNQTITLTPNCDVSGCAWTKYCVDTGTPCTVSSGTAYTAPVQISTENTSYFRYASQDNAANTQTTVPLTVKIDTTVPTTAAGGNGYTFNTWTNSSSVSVTLTCGDGAGSGCLATLYCTDTLNTCTPTTAYTTGVAVSTEGTSYIRYYSTDAVSNTETAKSQTIKIDTILPVISGLSPAQGMVSSLPSSVSFTLSEIGYCRSSSSDLSYTDMTSANDCSGGGTTSITCNVSTSNPHSLSAHVSCQDDHGNENTASNNTNFYYHIPGGASGGGTTFNPPAPEPAPAPVAVEPPSIVEQIVQVPQQLVEQINNLGQQVADIINALRPGQPEEQIAYPPIKEAVPVEAPIALQGWDVMEVRPISQFSLTPVKSDIAFFSDRIPQFKQALTAFGIDVNNLADVKKVSGTELYLPGLTRVALTQNEILAINKFEPEQTISAPEVVGGAETGTKELLQPGELALNKFAAVQGVPLADMSSAARQKIPTDIVFVRSGGELIDYKMAISVDNLGQVKQKINTIAGRTMELVIKPDQPASSVTGYITLNKVAVGKEPANILGYMTRFLTASLIDSTGQSAPELPAGNALLLTKFTYVEKAPGIYVASITAPQTEGEYDISTVIQYQDINLAPKETKMTAIVNPEGYVYSQMPEGRLRIEGANISLLWLNPETNQYELWPADKFLQKNPILTDNTGKYSFLVPEGTYKIKATAFNYAVFESEPFVMKEDIAVNKNIELFKKAGWLSWLNWQTMITVLLIILITYNFWQNERLRNIIFKIFRKKIKVESEKNNKNN